VHAKLVPIVAVAAGALAMMAGQAAGATASGSKGTAVLKSPDLAGYAVTPSKLISAQATIKIPKITCASSGDSGIAPGVYLFGGYSGYSAAFAGPNCENGQASYAAYITINGAQETVFGVRPGNTVAVSISETARKTTATVRDLTTGRRKSLSGAGSDKTQVFVASSLDLSRESTFGSLRTEP
jgi:Peptidase A4 family